MQLYIIGCCKIDYLYYKIFFVYLLSFLEREKLQPNCNSFHNYFFVIGFKSCHLFLTNHWLQVALVEVSPFRCQNVHSGNNRPKGRISGKSIADHCMIDTKHKYKFSWNWYAYVRPLTIITYCACLNIIYWILVDKYFLMKFNQKLWGEI